MKLWVSLLSVVVLTSSFVAAKVYYANSLLFSRTFELHDIWFLILSGITSCAIVLFVQLYLSFLEPKSEPSDS